MNSLADGSIIIDTRLDSNGLEKGIKKLNGAASVALKGVIAGVAAVGAAVATAGGYAFKVGSEFEASMSQVAATMGITASEIAKGSSEYELMEKAAKDAGSTTKYSASQASEALNYLALAGYDAQKAVETLPTVLNLAAAGGLDLAYASDLVTDSMSALGDMAGTVEQFSDKLAKTSQKSNTSVAQLGEAILTVGGTAKILAGGTTELNTALGILADNGDKGSEGGTALRNVILSLSAPTDKAAKEMKRLGLEVYDAEGNMRPLNETFGDLDKTLSTMTTEEKSKVLNTLFNSVDLKSVNALLANSGERFDELSGYIDDADGAAAAMAETMNDNLQGRLAELNSAMEGLGISIYSNIANPAKDAVEVVTGYISELNSLLSGDSLDIEDMADWFANNPGALEEYKAQIDQYIELGMTAEDATEKATENIKQTIGMSKIPDAVANIITDMLKNIANAIPKFIETSVEITSAMLDSINGSSDEMVQSGGELLLALARGIVKLIPKLAETAANLVVSLVKYIWNNKGEMLKAAKDLIFSLVDGIIAILGVLFGVGKDIVRGIWEGMLSMKDWLLGKVKGLCESILGSVKSFFGIHSPSRVFRDEVGKMLGVGMAEGISSTEQLLVDTMETIGDRLLDEASSTEDKLKILEEEKSKERFDLRKKYGIDGLEENYRAFLDVEASKVAEKEKRLEEIELEQQKIKEEKKLLESKKFSDKKMLAEKEALEKKLVMEQESLNKELALLGQFESNYTSAYESMVTEYEKAYDIIMSKQEALESKLKAFGELYDVIKDEEGKEIGIKLSDLQEDIDIITKYGESLEALKAKGNVTQEFLDEILAMSVDDGLKYMELLLSQTDTDFDNYINLWNIKQKKAKEVAQKYYKDQFNTLKADFTDKVEKQLGLLPDKSKKIGLDASKQLADGMKANSGLVYSVIDGFIDKLEEMERAAISAQQAAQEAASASQSYSVSSYSVTNDSRSTTQNVNFYGKTATPGETYRAIKQASKELIE